jgi:hypothetical protein
MNLDFRPIIISAPNEMVSADLFGPLPASQGQVKHVLVMYDVFSKLVKFYAIKKASTTAILNRYAQYFQTVAKPKVILSDRGTQFSSKTYQKALSQQNIKYAYTSVRHPQANPVERIRLELGRLCRSYCETSHTSWAKYLPSIEKWINSNINFTTNFPPNLIQFGTNSNSIIQ